MIGGKAEVKSLVEQVVVRLRDDIVFNFYAPGVKLNIEALKKRYQMGGSPIREALNRLVVEGLVEALPLRGFQVAQISFAHGRDILDNKARLERLMADQILVASDDEWESGCIALLHRLRRCKEQVSGESLDDWVRWIDLSRRFVLQLYSQSSSSWLTTAYSGLYLHYMRYEFLVFSADENPLGLIHQQFQWYEGILNFFLDREIAGIHTSLEEYLSTFTGLVEGVFKMKGEL